MSNTCATIFVVDDDPSVRRAVARLLRSNGFLVETFQSGRKFLETAAPPCRGCIVLDVRMPGLSGFDLMECLARRGTPLPVILISGDGDDATAERAAKAGCVRFLAKPFEEEALLEAVREALRPPDDSSESS